MSPMARLSPYLGRTGRSLDDLIKPENRPGGDRELTRADPIDPLPFPATAYMVKGRVQDAILGRVRWQPLGCTRSSQRLDGLRFFSKLALVRKLRRSVAAGAVWLWCESRYRADRERPCVTGSAYDCGSARATT